MPHRSADKSPWKPPTRHFLQAEGTLSGAVSAVAEYFIGPSIFGGTCITYPATPSANIACNVVAPTTCPAPTFCGTAPTGS